MSGPLRWADVGECVTRRGGLPSLQLRVCVEGAERELWVRGVPELRGGGDPVARHQRATRGTDPGVDVDGLTGGDTGEALRPFPARLWLARDPRPGSRFAARFQSGDGPFTVRGFGLTPFGRYLLAGAFRETP